MSCHSVANFKCFRYSKLKDHTFIPPMSCSLSHGLQSANNVVGDIRARNIPELTTTTPPAPDKLTQNPQ